VRARLCLALACALLALGAVAPAQVFAAGSLQGGGAFSELSEKAQEDEATTTTSETGTTAATKEPSNSEKTIFIAAGAAAVLLLAIAFVIVRDARRVAPAGAEEFNEGRSAHDQAVRMRNRRTKAKAARRQRKKNR
jgi:hypothetical protein